MSKVEPQYESFAALRNPIVSLPAFGHVLHQATGKEILYDPSRITTDLQTTLLSYLGNPPKNELGHNRWLCLLGYRQGGKSPCAELGAYALTAYTPGHDHVCIADTKHRADYLHQRVHFNHKRWDEKFRSPTVPNRESRQLTFDCVHCLLKVGQWGSDNPRIRYTFPRLDSFPAPEPL